MFQLSVQRWVSVVAKLCGWWVTQLSGWIVSLALVSEAVLQQGLKERLGRRALVAWVEWEVQWVEA